MKDETQRSTVESRSSCVHPYVCVFVRHRSVLSSSPRPRHGGSTCCGHCSTATTERHRAGRIKTRLVERASPCPLFCVSVILLVGLSHTHTHTKVRCRVHSGRGIDNVCDAKSRGRCCCCLLTRCTAFRMLAIGGAHTNGNSRVRRKKRIEASTRRS